jgi:hypothetical protein
MTTTELASAFVALLREGKHDEAAATFNHPEIVSLEAMEAPMARLVGTEAVKGKAIWWYDNHEVHGGTVDGPYVNGDEFIVRFTYDITTKATGVRQAMEEAGLYTVKNGKIVEEKFYYVGA